MTRSLRSVYVLLFAGVCFFAVGPLVGLLLRVFSHPEYFGILFEKETLRALAQTVRLCGGALFLALLLALPLSWLLVRTDLPGRDRLRRVFQFPYMLPPYLFAIAWATLAIPTVGFLNRWFGNWFNIYSASGLIWVFATAYLPILTSSLCQALESMDPSLEESARVCGAGPARVAFSITFPCLLPTIASVSLLFLLAVLSAFGVPALIGNPARLYVLTTRIYSYAKLGGLSGTDKAFAVSLWLVGSAIIFIAVNEWLRRRFLTRLVVGKAARHSLVSLGRMRLPIWFLTVSIAFVIVILPLGAIFLSSFLRVAGDLRPANFTLENYAYLFEMAEFSRSVINSLYLAGLTGLVCVVVAFFIAYYCDRTQLPLRKLFENLASFPFAIPGAVIALALIVSFGSGWGFRRFALLGSPLLLLIAYAVKYLALSVQNMVPAMASLDPNLDEAGRVSGAGPWGVLLRILAPLLFPAFLHVFMLTVLPVLSELTMSVLLTGPGLETLGTLMFQLQEYAHPSAACALATLLVVFLVALVGGVRRLGAIGRRS
ncbi:MAG: iron ABC transporter permease [Bdellovibrionaceae bacterium]|nr:iron ABC transporter permease [Pseudobdellovibrionaceae bacterium]